MVPRVGLEPTRGCPHQILSLARLPVSPPRQGLFVVCSMTVPWSRRLPTLPPGDPGSTLGAGGLSMRVRDGSARVPPAVGVDSQGRCAASPPGADAPRGLVSFQIGQDPSGIPGHLPCQTTRPLSTGRLRALPRFHLRPIKQVVFLRPSGSAEALREEVLGGGSRLDAFSGSPFRTQLPGGAAGATTGSPEVRPPRSSRTGGGLPHSSCARSR